MTVSSEESLRIRKLQEQVRLKEKQLELREGLPFLYGWKWYPWAKEFFDSFNKINLLCAANQVSKSSTQIRKCIDWATNTKKWPKLWLHKPTQFWYLYPTSPQATIEFEKKWVEFLPKGKFKDDPVYGWKEVYKNKEISELHFNSGVSVYFKTYSQNEAALQTGTVDALFCFVAGTQVETPFGTKPVESIKVGDLVLSADGWKPVIRTMNKECPVITKKFSNGTSLTGTPEHPIWTKNRGWVHLGELQQGDICCTVPKWGIRHFWRTWNWFCLTALYLIGSLNTKIREPETTSSIAKGKLSMLLSGRRIIPVVYQKVMSFTTRTTIRWIIGQKISSYSHDQNTQPITSEKNGKKKENTSASVKLAEKYSLLEVPRERFQDDARKNAENSLTWLLLSALSAALHSLTGKIKSSCTVLDSAQTDQSNSVVYNLEVADSHTYFANGILTHNCDEELPVNLYEELMFRISASDGYFHMVFTATLGQDFWRLAMEPESFEEETLPDAWKKCVSLYDAQFYVDGTPSHWTDQKINIVKNRCRNHKEVLKRVYGKFIRDDSGRKYEQFDVRRHIRPKAQIPKDWLIYAGVDPGSGGTKSHPGAICFIAVSPDYARGRVISGWRGDGIETTAGDVLTKYQELRDQIREDLGLEVTEAFYDWASKDFKILADRSGEAFLPADKSHERGEQIINVLFKNDMLVIEEDEELHKLASELIGLRKDTPKNKAKDDFSDGMRYGVTRIPWDFTQISSEEIRDPDSPLEKKQEEPLTPMQQQIMERRNYVAGPTTEEDHSIWSPEAEISEWNQEYGNDI